MKGLEIIKKQIKTDKHDLEFFLECGIDKSLLKYKYIGIEEKEIIKQDLEVLEIIKNQHININKLEDILKNEEDIEIALIKYNFEFYGKNEYILTLKEIRKLKQWLEENENA